jgi:prevent-host-death family protein
MKTASISEAKNRLSAYIDLVRKGESVLITDRDVPVARLEPLAPGLPASEEALLSNLERKGVIKRAKMLPGKSFLKGLPPAPRIKGDLLDALIADREEGR